MKNSLLLYLSTSIFTINSANTSWSKPFASFAKRFARHEYVSGVNYYQDRLAQPLNNNLLKFNQNELNYSWMTDLAQLYNQKNFYIYELQQQFFLQQAAWNPPSQLVFFKQFFSKLNKNLNFSDLNIALKELGANSDEYSWKREEYSWIAQQPYKNMTLQVARKPLDPKLFGIYESAETKDFEAKCSRDKAKRSDYEHGDSSLFQNLKIFKIEKVITPPVLKNFKQNPWKSGNYLRKNNYIFL